MHPSRLRLGPSQSRPLTDASPGSARSPGLRVYRAAPSRRRTIHTHAPFRTERQSFLRCRDMRLTRLRNQRSGRPAALRGHRPQGIWPRGQVLVCSRARSIRIPRNSDDEIGKAGGQRSPPFPRGMERAGQFRRRRHAISRSLCETDDLTNPHVPGAAQGRSGGGEGRRRASQGLGGAK